MNKKGPLSKSPQLAVASLPAPPPPGSIQFFDGYFPALTANSYTIDVTQDVAGDGESPSYTITQGFVVQAPEFSIDPGIIQTIFPPNGSTDIYDQDLPFIVLTDPSLPWERSLVPETDQPDPAGPLPWMALVIFAEGEIYLQSGSNNPVATGTVEQLVTADPNENVLKPQFPSDWISADTLASQCQTITITGAAFNAVMPQKTDLPYLAHCRAVRSAAEGEALLSVLLSNRLAVADTRQAPAVPAAPLRYYAHLVSLEGFASYLGPDATPIPLKSDGKELMDVQLASLTNWSFVSLPETAMSFEQLIKGLITSEQATPALRLAVEGNPDVPQPVLDRLQGGYAPLTFVTGAGEESFAWYRGPFTPVVPQPLPAVDDPPVDTRHAANADSLMIYLAEEGLFDLSYAAAWNIGRELALADAQFAQAINGYRQSANVALARLAQRMSLPHFAAGPDAGELIAKRATQTHFSRLVGDGLGRVWGDVLASARNGDRPDPEAAYRTVRFTRRTAIEPRAALAVDGAGQAIAENVQDVLDSIAAWLANLSLLYPVPFSHLVPDPRMLPTESVRFFYVDQGWIDALIGGALSIALHGSADVALLAAVRPHLNAAIATHQSRMSNGAIGTSGSGGTGLTGMLIRSQLVSGWPELVVGPTLGGAPLPIVRNDCPSPTVRLCLFQGVPDTVSLGEPYQGLQFGVEDNPELSNGVPVIYPRCVTDPAVAGVQLLNVQSVEATQYQPQTGAVGGVLQVAALAATLETAAGVIPFAAGAVIQWNGNPLATTFVGSNQLSAVVPQSLVTTAGTAAVTVEMGGVSSAPATFTIDAALAIDEIRPPSAGAGSAAFTLTVDGVGYGTDAIVQWNGAALKTTVTSVMEVSAQVTADLISSTGQASVTVTSGGAVSNSVTFAIIGDAPAIDTIAPNIKPAGASGFALTVTGTGFTSGSSVEWNGSPLATRFISSEQLAAAVPASVIANTGTASVTVVSTDGTSNAVTFSIAGADPTIGLVHPNVALAGGSQFTLVVDGVNFATGAVVQWNGSPLATVVDDPEQLTATVPAELVATAGAVSITVLSGGVTSNAMPFTVIISQPTIGLLEPGTVVAGVPQFTLNVYGGFGAGDFALQVVRAPERQSFIPESS